MESDLGGLRARTTTLLLAALLFAIAVLAAVDLATDLRDGVAMTHVVGEAIVIALCAVGVVTAGLRLRSLRVDLTDTQRRLAASTAEAERWRTEARGILRGLGAAIDRQFSDWKLTPAEREVALMLLKGLSHREIAGVREVSERTVREQARAVYRKAGLSGRADLAAFFLEDLLLPA